MKEHMYTYHYFQNRAIKRPSRVGDLLFHLILFSSTVYIVTTLVLLR
ncbi:hypothetical protein SATMO3_46470 [Sporomusa aerivorans]